MKTEPIKLSAAERRELERRVRSRRGRAEEARIARVLLLLAEGETYQRIAELVGCSEPFISKWKKRFVAEHDFREFTFTNAAMLHTRNNPSFFKGTVVEQAVADELGPKTASWTASA